MSTVHPSQLPAIVSDLGLKAQAEGYAMEPRVAPLIFETMTISASSPPEGMSEVVISGGKKPGEIARGQAAPARTLDQAYQWFMRIRKFAERIEIPEEMYNSPNGSALVAEMITTATKGWGEGWAQVQEEAAADLFNKGVLAAGHAPTFDGGYSGRPATYSAFIYDGKPFFAATGNGHPLSLASGTTKFNLIVSAALGSTTLDTARVMMESTNAVDEVGDKISIRPNVLVVPPGLTQTAHVLLESQLKPGTAQNDVNWTAEQAIRPLTWRYLTDPDGWFLGQAGKGVMIASSGDLLRISTSAPDPSSGSVTVRAVGYYGHAVKNWRYWSAHNLATS